MLVVGNDDLPVLLDVVPVADRRPFNHDLEETGMVHAASPSTRPRASFSSCLSLSCSGESQSPPEQGAQNSDGLFWLR